MTWVSAAGVAPELAQELGLGLGLGLGPGLGLGLGPAGTVLVAGALVAGALVALATARGLE